MLIVEIHFAVDVASEATGERSWAMRSFAFLHQMPDGGIVQQGGSAGRRNWNCMAVGTGMRPGGFEHEVAMRIVQDPDGNRREGTAMLGMAAEAHIPTMNGLEMDAPNRGRGMSGELVCGMAGDAFGAEWTMKGFVAVHASSDLTMIPAHIARRP